MVKKTIQGSFHQQADRFRWREQRNWHLARFRKGLRLPQYLRSWKIDNRMPIHRRNDRFNAKKNPILFYSKTITTPDLRPLISEYWPQISDLWSLTSEYWPLTSDFWLLTSDHRPLPYENSLFLILLPKSCQSKLGDFCIPPPCGIGTA